MKQASVLPWVALRSKLIVHTLPSGAVPFGRSGIEMRSIKTIKQLL